MKELKINDQANKENIKIFKRYNLTNSAELRHTCVLCGKKTSINDSFSNSGAKLICWHCAYKNFKDEDGKNLLNIVDLMRWVRDE